MTTDSRRFPSTRWTQIRDAGEGSQEALAALCETYWSPVYHFIQRHNQTAEEAIDLTQDFFAKQLLPTAKTRLLRKVDPERRFRLWLLGAVRHHLSNTAQKSRAQIRNCGVPAISLDRAFSSSQAEQEGSTFWLDPGHKLTPEHAYCRRWALLVLERALDRLDAQEEGSDLFRALRPLLVGPEGEQPAYRPIAHAFGVQVGLLKTRVHRYRRDLAEFIDELILETLASDADLPGEKRFLLRALTPPSDGSTLWTHRDCDAS